MPPQRPLKTLERVLSKAGLGSRTEARSWIGAGRVRVNGRVVETPDRWVDIERDRVTLDGHPVRGAKKVYLLLYKPKGYITTYTDPQGRPTVYDLVRGSAAQPSTARAGRSRRPIPCPAGMPAAVPGPCRCRRWTAPAPGGCRRHGGGTASSRGSTAPPSANRCPGSLQAHRSRSIRTAQSPD